MPKNRHETDDNQRSQDGLMQAVDGHHRQNDEYIVESLFERPLA
jgi:hypothetical protein